MKDAGQLYYELETQKLPWWKRALYVGWLASILAVVLVAGTGIYLYSKALDLWRKITKHGK